MFAALDVAAEKLIGQLKRRRRSAEFLQFLDAIDASVPADVAVRLIMNDYARHKTDTVRAWLARHPRYRAHFTPTPASWLHWVERSFSTLGAKWIKRGAPTGVKDREKSIREYLHQHTQDPGPFVWCKTADAIVGTVRGAAGKLA